MVPGAVILEATGGYERAVVAELAANGLPVVVVNPRQVREFARAQVSSPKPIIDAKFTASPLCHNLNYRQGFAVV